MPGENLTSAAAGAGYGVAVFSLEMPKRAWLLRSASAMTRRQGSPIEYERALQRKLGNGELEAFMRAGFGVRNLPILIDDAPGLTVADIAAKTRAARAKFDKAGTPLGLVAIDHIGKIRPAKTYSGNRHLEIGEITDRLAGLAKTENIAVLALHQLNRDVEQRDNKRPLLADLRESGRIEEDADVVMLIYRAHYYLSRDNKDRSPAEQREHEATLDAVKNIMEIDVAKNRNGREGMVRVFVDMGCNYVGNLEEGC
jgi:replicative DNA helicase